ncbi:HupE/UreJ family protein [Streptomyces sp. NPDC051001]|uniref:HupE/UreJ family protein n=1 Tax=Streptomyces sp. NPDC051001 TaxID=3155795 RepID=UPI0034398C39
MVRQDWAGGQVDDAGTTQGGTIRVDTRTMKVPALKVDLEEGSAWRGFLAMVKLGGDHILTGTDRLLFLLILLLPAPLAATAGRWSGLVGARSALGRIGRITLAFTAGHSVSLAATALGHLDIPGWPVEAFIAVSILIGAVHAIRPLFPGREALVAGLFGLGHGTAFSFVLAEMHLSTGQLVTSLLGFNLGIELVQLLLVCLGLPNPVARAADSAGSHTTAILATLAVTALAATAWTLATRRQTRHGTAGTSTTATADSATT